MSGPFGPPRALGGRIRWLFLGFGVFNLVAVVPRALLGHDAPPVSRAGAAVAAVVLAAWWLLRYRRQTFPPWAIPVEGAAILAVAVGLHDWVGTIGLTFAAVSFRGLYGTWRHVLAFTLIVFGAALGGVALTQPGEVDAMLMQAPGVPMLALFTAVVAEATGRQERGAARERVFARLGASLAGTAEAGAVSRLTAEAAVELLGGLPGAWAEVGLDTPRGTAFPLGHGTLYVGAAAPLPAEVRPALEALAAQAALGLANAERAAALHHHAFHDALTNLANRRLLREHLERAIARARRGSPTAVLLIDLDGFKRVNDTYGHAAGDQLLVTVADRLRDAIRGADTAARLGGDEFAIVLDGMESPGDALSVANRVLASIQTPLTAAGVEVTPAASVGVAIWRNQAEIDQLLHDADAAMYAAKQAGKGRVAIVTDGAARVLEPLPSPSPLEAAAEV